jgi:hypothetical protein
MFLVISAAVSSDLVLPYEYWYKQNQYRLINSSKAFVSSMRIASSNPVSVAWLWLIVLQFNGWKQSEGFSKDGLSIYD